MWFPATRRNPVEVSDEESHERLFYMKKNKDFNDLNSLCPMRKLLKLNREFFYLLQYSHDSEALFLEQCMVRYIHGAVQVQLLKLNREFFYLLQYSHDSEALFLEQCMVRYIHGAVQVQRIKLCGNRKSLQAYWKSIQTEYQLKCSARVDPDNRTDKALRGILKTSTLSKGQSHTRSTMSINAKHRNKFRLPIEEENQREKLQNNADGGVESGLRAVVTNGVSIEELLNQYKANEIKTFLNVLNELAWAGLEALEELWSRTIEASAYNRIATDLFYQMK
ncbi:hypothetical protein DICVIV_03377 [Dictyocaulus viviparus]|uniref:Uncharacterized protein n=1 Tax=Dictyocaulus viviparus TaxID=29172 RepID=A0A0D8Y2Q2_DICVI|nr:hypothetical protein DICVIV_03377 [Dictyocaulus viviparus]